MLYRSLIAACASACFITTVAFAGGTPDVVKYPEGYQKTFTNYVNMNRDGKDLLAKMYANDEAMKSYKDGKPATNGSVVIMEVYKPKKDADGKAVKGDDGLFVADKLAAVAVMERQDWGKKLDTKEQLSNWGFAFYKGDGSVKENKLDCVGCHTPLDKTDYLFTHKAAVDYKAPEKAEAKVAEKAPEKAAESTEKKADPAAY